VPAGEVGESAPSFAWQNLLAIFYFRYWRVFLRSFGL
jgi:hypothetical protein